MDLVETYFPTNEQFIAVGYGLQTIEDKTDFKRDLKRHLKFAKFYLDFRANNIYLNTTIPFYSLDYRICAGRS